MLMGRPKRVLGRTEKPRHRNSAKRNNDVRLTKKNDKPLEPSVGNAVPAPPTVQHLSPIENTIVDVQSEASSSGSLPILRLDHLHDESCVSLDAEPGQDVDFPAESFDTMASCDAATTSEVSSDTADAQKSPPRKLRKLDDPLLSLTSGCLVWAQLARYPYWPGVIVKDPDSEEFRSENERRTVSYHVYFINDCRRAWVAASSLLIYCSASDLMAHLADLRLPKKSRLYASIKLMLSPKFPSTKWGIEWRKSVDMCDKDYVPLSLETRIAMYKKSVQQFAPPKRKSVGGRRKSVMPRNDSVDNRASEDGKNEKRTSNVRKVSQLNRRSESPSSSSSSESEDDEQGSQDADDDFAGDMVDYTDVMSVARSEVVCFLCEDIVPGKEVVQCGGCWQTFHRDCVVKQDKLETVDRKHYRCAQCFTGRRVCFACKETTAPPLVQQSSSLPLTAANVAQDANGNSGKQSILQTNHTFESIDQFDDKKQVRGRKRVSKVASAEFKTVKTLENSTISSATGIDLDGSTVLTEGRTVLLTNGQNQKVNSNNANSASFLTSGQKVSKRKNSISGESPVLCSDTCIASGNAAMTADILNTATTSECEASSSLEEVGNVGKTESSSFLKCAEESCFRFYHESCLVKLKWHSKNKRDGTVLCPLHTCATCNVENWLQKTGGKDTRKVSCIRCPAAYHATDRCIPAGSEILNEEYIVCPVHYDRRKSNSKLTRINVDYCFECSKGGTLLLCEECPGSYHRECLDNEPERQLSPFVCDDCRNGRRLRYGDIVWCKFGVYRWWPAQIVHPKDVPTNLDREGLRYPGEFVVRFFGTRDHAWVHGGRVFRYIDGDTGGLVGTEKDLTSVAQAGKHLDRQFQKALTECSAASAELKASREQYDMENGLNFIRPAPYHRIRRNVGTPAAPVKFLTAATLDDYPVCMCSTEKPCNPDTCINALVHVECCKKLCPCPKVCRNMRFQRCQYPQVKVTKIPGKGFGLTVCEPVAKDRFVGEYVGELISEKECRQRQMRKTKNDETDFYFLTLDSRRIIDAEPKGNRFRFMNHSCEPNCATHVWFVAGDIRVGIFAVRDIAVGEELTFNYQMDVFKDTDLRLKCCCGAPTCAGWIGAKQAAPVKQPRKEGEKQKRVKKKSLKAAKVVHDVFCFRCDKGGMLVLCDAPSCPRSYHLTCVGIDNARGTWYCPWHYCDECEGLSAVFCEECDASYCNGHAAGNLGFLDGRFVCANHEIFDVADRTKYLMEHVVGEFGISSSESVDSSTEAESPLPLETAALADDVMKNPQKRRGRPPKAKK